MRINRITVKVIVSYVLLICVSEVAGDIIIKEISFIAFELVLGVRDNSIWHCYNVFLTARSKASGLEKYS